MTPRPSPNQTVTPPPPPTSPIGHGFTASTRPTASTPTTQAPRRAKTYCLGAATVLVGAGLAWLALTSELAATGRRIAALDAQRGDLLERRAAVLADYAANTDPRELARAAAAQGFGPPTHEVQYLDVNSAVVAGVAPHDARPGSPLDIMQAAVAPGAPASPPADGSLADLPAMLLSVGVAEPAAADEGGSAEESAVRSGSTEATRAESGHAAGTRTGTGR